MSEQIDLLLTIARCPIVEQRLAEHGLLPMFGFPTQVRYFYTRKPLTSNPWPPPGAIDRDLRVAVSEFAPGNEIVLDKFVYRSLGVVSLQPVPHQQPRPSGDPLGRTIRVGLCDVCKNIDEKAGHACSNCGALPSDGYRNEVDLAFPNGFRAEWGKKRERFEGMVDRLTRASVPRVSVDTGGMSRHKTGGLVVMGGSTRIYTVNDNRGRCFDFKPTDDASLSALNSGAFDATDAGVFAVLLLGRAASPRLPSRRFARGRTREVLEAWG